MLDSILLEACNPELNIWRSYRITFGQDLFGSWIVELSYGRIGSKGRSRTILAENEAQAMGYVEQCLKKRQSAPKRIGTSYRIKQFSGEGNTSTLLSKISGEFQLANQKKVFLK